MQYGAWIHTGGGLSLDSQAALAVKCGIGSLRSYSYDYALRAAPALQETGMGLLAGMHIDAGALIADWQSQIHLEILEKYHQLGVPLTGVCVGNELREGGDAPESKRFTARLSFGLANVVRVYRHWLDDHGYSTPLTYAMEGLVQDSSGDFHEWVLPLIDAVDMVGMNLYPMGHWEWFTYRAFEESRKFLFDPRTRNDRLVAFEYRLRRALAQLQPLEKPLILTETGFPSATAYHMDEDLKLVIPESDNQRYGTVMGQYLDRIRGAADDYQGMLRAVYFYEWRDNLYHSKIWNVEQSPIHVAFGLCDQNGRPKFDIKALLSKQQRC
ncbi:MAG: hypothetical protein P1S60_11275 [Anaerolineae bacterium]|nr:hypothetical protein [Anaerolineae bacterium]